MTLPQNISAVLDRLTSSGFEAYIVGGCVRDMLMGREPSDFDITTSASPEQTLAVFGDMHTLTHGMKHGTVTVMADGEPVEITTFRKDGEYKDSRHPETVSFDATLEQDLARRDFTCNAMAYDPAEGLVDIFGGQEDIKNGVIRAVGDPEERFNEDALRILRALRFASVLGFEIEEKTAQAAKKCSPLLANVSGERIYAELSKLLCGKNCFNIIMDHPEVLDRVVPGILRMKGYSQHNSYHIYTLLEHTARVVMNVPAKPYMRLAALLHDIGKPDCQTVDKDDPEKWHFHGHPERSVEMAEEIIHKLKCDGETRDRALGIIKYHDVRFKADEKMILRWLGKLGEEMFLDILDLHYADITAQNPLYFDERAENLAGIRAIIADAVAKQRCFTVSSLAINGKDIIALGIPQGQCVGALLDALLEEVIDGKLENERNNLLERAKELADLQQ